MNMYSLWGPSELASPNPQKSQHTQCAFTLPKAISFFLVDLMEYGQRANEGEEKPARGL